MVTILITLFSGTLVGSLIYLGVVVRKLRCAVNCNVSDILNLQNEIKTINRRVDEEVTSITNNLSGIYSELDSKINSRYDKLLDKISSDLHQSRLEMIDMKKVIASLCDKANMIN